MAAVINLMSEENMSEEIKALPRQFVAGMNSKDAAKIESLIHPNCVE